MIVVRCKNCNVEISSSSKTQCCGCPNMMTVTEDKVSAVDLSQIVMIKSGESKKQINFLLKILLIKKQEGNVKFAD